MNNNIYFAVKSLKRGVFFLFCSLVVFPGISQPNQNKYFLNEMSGINKMNPAFVPEYGYYSFPVIGRFSTGINSTAGVSNFLFPMDGKFALFMNKAVPANDFLSKLSPNTTINQSMSFDLFSFGFFTKRNSFWSFNVGYRENLNLNLPYDFFALAKKGMSSSTATYDLSNIRFEQNNIADVSLGYSRKIGSKVRVGVNAKLLIGLAAARVNYSKFDVTFDQSKFSVNSKGDMLLMADAISFKKDANNIYQFDGVDVNASASKPIGYGSAFDLGITYNPFSRLTLSASVNDLGSLKWNKASVKHGVAEGGVSFNGFTAIDANNVNIDDQVKQLKEDAKTLIQFKEAPVTETYKYDLPTITRASAEFSIFNNPSHDISLGVLYQNYSSTYRKTNELTGAVNIRPFSWLMFTGSAAMLTKDYNRYGLAMSFSPCWINFFIASDYVVPNVNKQFVPIDAFNLNFETGFSIPFGKSRRKVSKMPPVVVPAPVPLPVAVPVDTVKPVVKDTMPVVKVKDTLVVLPSSMDSAQKFVEDSIRAKLVADSIMLQRKADSIKMATPVVVPVVPVVPPVVVPAPEPAVKPNTTQGLKPKAVKPKKGKVLPKAKKAANGTSTTKSTTTK